MFITVYALLGLECKRQLLEVLTQHIKFFACDCVAMRDFNEVQDDTKRFGSQYYHAPHMVF